MDNKKTSVGRVRWTILAMLLCATTINYMDRVALAQLKPIFEVELKWHFLGRSTDRQTDSNIGMAYLLAECGNAKRTRQRDHVGSTQGRFELNRYELNKKDLVPLR